MNYFDLIVLVPLLWGAFRGFKNGFIIEAFSLAALIFGVFGAYKLTDIISAFLVDKFEWNENYVKIFAFIGLFFIIIILMHLLAKLIDSMVKKSAAVPNIVIGIIFGIFKYILIVSLLVMILDRFNSRHNFMDPALIANSFSYQYLLKIAHFVFENISF